MPFVGLLFSIVIGIIIYFSKNSDKHSYMKSYIKEVESDTSKTILSKHETASFSYEIDENNLFCFYLTPRILVEQADTNYTYTLRALKEKETIGVSISIAKNKINLIDTLGNNLKGYPIIFYSTNKESDLMLEEILALWCINKKGAPRMKKKIQFYTKKFEGGFDSFKRQIKFLVYLIDRDTALINPSFEIDIDWQNGFAKIKEYSIHERELIFNQLMV